MKKVEVVKLKGIEEISRDIYTDTGIVLIPKGTIIKKTYIEKLIELNIFYVHIKENDLKDCQIINNEKIIQECTNKVKKIIEKHFYSNKSELAKVVEIAEKIILKVFELPEIILNINSIRHSSEDNYFHAVNVCAISVLMAVKMKLSDEEIKNIAIGALLHDIGYNYVDANLKNVKLSRDNSYREKEMKNHVIYGYSLVENEKWISEDSKDIILFHHEREDGSGYPLGKVGNNIKIGTKIVAIADEFDNIVNGKYNSSMKVYMAIDLIVCQSGRLFESSVINAFRNTIAAYPTGTVVITNEKEIGVVISQNMNCPTRPVIKILRDNNGNEVKEDIFRNLTKELTVFIDDTIE